MIKRVLFFLLLSASVVFAQKVETLGAFSGEATEKVKAALEPAGYRVYLPNTLAACDIWLAANVPTAGKKDAHGASYPEFADSGFLGVITFPKGGGKDFRGQPIRPGSYTMRYQLLPDDGNHLGVAPNPDFVLLVPIADDPDPAAAYDFGKLVELSAAAAKTQHPAAFEMMPAESGEPSATQTDDGWIVFHATVASAGKRIPIALVAKGSAAQ